MDATSSDHRLITSLVDGRRRSGPRRRKRGTFSLKKADWKLYLNRFKEVFDEEEVVVDTLEDVVRSVGYLQAAIRRAAEAAIPRKVVGGRRGVPWWSPEVSVLREEFRMARRVWKRAVSRGWDEDRIRSSKEGFQLL